MATGTVPSFSRIFGIDEPFLGFPQLRFEIANSTVERPEVFLGGEVEPLGDASNGPLERPLRAATKLEHANDQPPSSWVFCMQCATCAAA